MELQLYLVLFCDKTPIIYVESIREGPKSNSVLKIIWLFDLFLLLLFLTVVFAKKWNCITTFINNSKRFLFKFWPGFLFDWETVADPIK